MRAPRTARRRWSGLLVGLLGAAAVLLGPAPVAAAHTSLVDSDPQANATLLQSPRTVTLVFDEAPEQFAATVVLTDPDGGTVQATDPRVDGTELTVDVPELTAPGRYRIAYRVVSADGHPVTGEFGFSFAPRTPTRTSAAPSSPVPGSTTPGTAAPTTAVSSTAASSAVESSTGESSTAVPSPVVPSTGASSGEITASGPVGGTGEISTASVVPTQSTATSDPATGSSAASTSPSTSAPEPPRAANSGSGSVWLLVIVAAVLLLGAAGAFVLARRHRHRAEHDRTG